MNASAEHQQRILDQFSRQAAPFAAVPAHIDAIPFLAQCVNLSAADRVLDVACGPGLVACEFARVAGHVTGIDITPAMIAQAAQRSASLANVDWRVGDAVPLPFPNGSFSVVVTRYSFHHFLDPAAALREMIRVCAPRGRVLIADVAIPEACAEAYDALERTRDPSHHHALTFAQWERLLADTGLHGWERWAYDVDVELEALLGASFPPPGGAEAFRAAVTADIGPDRLGIRARREKGTIRYTYPIGVFAAQLP